ncbi:MAG: SH3 domain-containing protein [Lewinellaceae bacterium]|nr:SH3 domain-containing protein [Lewinellaceae bacterium]
MKPIIVFSISVLAAITILFACKNDPKQTISNPSETTQPTPPPSPKPEVYLYAVSVDKLNLRDQPDKNGKVVTQFAEGDFVEGLGEVSSNKEEVTPAAYLTTSLISK